MESVRRNKLAIFIFMFPAVLLFVVIIVAPIIMSTYYSLLDWDGFNKPEFVGIGNYFEIFKSKTANFDKSIINALILAALSVFLQLPFALILSLILAKGIKGEKFFVGVFFIPVLMSSIVIGQLWRKMYHYEYGIVNMALKSVGLGNLARDWLGEQNLALMAVLIPILWQFIGYHMLLMYAGIKSVPADLREASIIEGATEFQISRYIIIPIIKPVLRVCTIIAVTGSLKAFDLILILTDGGPGGASEVPSTLMVRRIFTRNQYGLGSSIAIFIIVMCFFFAILIQNSFKSEVENE